jgi:DNA-binding LacI/PurR family transcriptional regulator
VPTDVSVVGFDDISPCKYIEPPLTTVHVPLYELGVRGLRLALDLLAGHDRPRPVSLPLELTVRSSTRAPKVPAGVDGIPVLYTGT